MNEENIHTGYLIPKQSARTDPGAESEFRAEADAPSPSLCQPLCSNFLQNTVSVAPSPIRGTQNPKIQAAYQLHDPDEPRRR